MPDPEIQHTLDLIEADFSDTEIFYLHHQLMAEAHESYLYTVADIYHQRASSQVAEEGPRLKHAATEFFVAFTSLSQVIGHRHTRTAATQLLANDIVVFDRKQSEVFSKLADIDDVQMFYPSSNEIIGGEMRRLASIGLSLTASSRRVMTNCFCHNLHVLLDN